jgi:hypothetical protein
MDFIVTLIKVGGVAASLAFLWFGYDLLNKELGKKDKDGNPVPLSDLAAKAIYTFMGFAALFFVLGAGLQIGDYLIRTPTVPALYRLVLSEWSIDRKSGEIEASIVEQENAQKQALTADQRGDFKVVLGVRDRQATAPDAGTYPITLGPFDFGDNTNLKSTVTPEQIASLRSKCADFVVFAIPIARTTDLPPSGAFTPATFGNELRVLSRSYSCS